jgi:hypothetical protein
LLQEKSRFFEKKLAVFLVLMNLSL